MTGKSMETFQDLRLRAIGGSFEALRDVILRALVPPWSHDVAREVEVREYAAKDDVIALLRDASDGLDEAALFLFQSGAEYRITNIVPRRVNELGVSKYNAILRDFVARVAEPLAKTGLLEIEQTSALQTIDDWLDADSVTLLRQFSNLANKSTGASHPMDQRRWFAFLTHAHREGSDLDPSRLSRWLIESESWDEHMAFELARDYEFGRELLKWYDAQ